MTVVEVYGKEENPSYWNGVKNWEVAPYCCMQSSWKDSFIYCRGIQCNQSFGSQNTSPYILQFCVVQSAEPRQSICFNKRLEHKYWCISVPAEWHQRNDITLGTTEKLLIKLTNQDCPANPHMSQRRNSSRRISPSHSVNTNPQSWNLKLKLTVQTGVHKVPELGNMFPGTLEEQAGTLSKKQTSWCNLRIYM